MDKPIFTLPINEIICGDTIEVLKTFPDESIDMVMTSPPYWALRDYGITGQLGLELTFQEYITKLCNIFDEVKRVLKKTGTCWVNMGDTYCSQPAGNKDQSKETGEGWFKGRNNLRESNIALRKIRERFDKKNYGGLGEKQTDTRILGRGRGAMTLEKSLVQIPFRFSIEMTNRGWILRNVIIWHKPNCMPSSVKDRFTVDFEYVFFFVKNKKYWFETQYEPHLTQENRPDGIIRNREFMYKSKLNKIHYKKSGLRANHSGFKDPDIRNPQGRNKRCVWTITTKPFKDAHFAVFPEALCEIPIKAGCPKDGIVLDPFCGSGTTCLVAKKLNRNYIGIDLSPTYVEMAKKRILNECGGLF